MTSMRGATAIEASGLTFGQFIDAAADRFGAGPAMVAYDRSAGDDVIVRKTYRELAQEVHALQAALAAEGVQPGDRVSVWLSSFPEWIVYLFALTRLGAAFVPVNPRFGSHELRFVLEHSGSSTLVAAGAYLGRDYAATIAEVIGDWRPGGGGALPELRRIIGVRTRPHPAALDTGELIERGRRMCATHGLPAASADVDATAVLFYTSGTTAFPKGVPLTHRNLLPHSVECGSLIGLSPADRVLTLYPFFGISGGANKVLSTFGSGACLVFQDAFRAGEAFDLLHREQCTVVHALDVQLRELVAIAQQRHMPVPERRGTIAFMSGVDASLAADIGKWLGLDRFIHAYGMTETNPMVLRNELDDPLDYRLRPGGRCAPHAEVRVVEARTGAPRASGEPGEIEVRGETVMKGYFKDPEATAEAFRNGWFRTGDIGVMTGEGHIFYLGRSRDMLKVGGFNVAPQEVEAFLRTLDAIEDVAVTGVADSRLGEVVVAFVKLRPGFSLDTDAVRQLCRGHIANFKTPGHVAVVDRLPYHIAAHGAKLRRDVLRAWAQERFAVPPVHSCSQNRGAS